MRNITVRSRTKPRLTEFRTQDLDQTWGAGHQALRETPAGSASTAGGKPGEVASSSTDGSGAMLFDTSWAATTASTRTSIEAPWCSGCRIRAITGPGIAVSSLSAISTVAECAPDGYLFVDAIPRIQARQSRRCRLGIQGLSPLSGSGQLAGTFSPFPPLPPEEGLDLPPARNVPGSAPRPSVPAVTGAASHGRGSGPSKMMPRQNRRRARSPPSPVEGSSECPQNSTERWVAGVSRR